MPYTLEIGGSQKIPNPTPDDLHRAIHALDTEGDDAFLILIATDMTYLQTAGDPNVGFDLEYQEGSLQNHFRAVNPPTVDDLVRIFTAYAAGSSDWKTLAEWEHVEL